MLWSVVDYGGRLMFFLCVFLLAIRGSQTGEKFSVRPCLVVLALFAAMYFYWRQVIAIAPPQLYFFHAVLLGMFVAGLILNS